jgi:RNA-directed DNA polymerase
MVQDEDYRTAVFGKTERTVGWEGDGEPAMTGLVRHCTRGNPQKTDRPILQSLSHPFTLDGCFGFERQDDAQRVMAVLSQRLERFGLTLHPQKTRLLDFRRPLRSRGEGRSPTTFEFLGFCWYWRRTRTGSWSVACKTRRARLMRAIRAVYEWCRDHRHLPVSEQHASLVRRVQGHFNYFGVNGNGSSLRCFHLHVWRSWYKWLNRRSQRARLTWERYKDLLRDFPLPMPRIVVRIWR